MASPKVRVEEALNAAQTEAGLDMGPIHELEDVGAQGVYPLIAFVRDDEPGIRQAAAIGLSVVAGTAEGEDFIEPLLKRAIPVLIMALSEDEVGAVRAAAAQALGAIDAYYQRDKMTIDFSSPGIEPRVRKMDAALTKAATDSDPAVRAAASQALSKEHAAPAADTQPLSSPADQASTSGKDKMWWQFWK